MVEENELFRLLHALNSNLFGKKYLSCWTMSGRITNSLHKSKELVLTFLHFFFH